MNITIFGYPKSGKTTLFNLLTGAKVAVHSYEAGLKDPNWRTCPIPDPRLETLGTLFPDKEKKPAVIDIIDLAGISFGEVKNSMYLNYLRKADGLTHVVRAFQNPEIPHLRSKISASDDILAMEDELILTDLVTVETRHEKVEIELKRSPNQEGTKEIDLLEKIQSHLKEGKAIRQMSLTPGEDKMMRSFAFLSQKPLLHMINLDEKDIEMIENPENIDPDLNRGLSLLAFCGKIEMEILELEDNEKRIFLKEYGIKEPSSPKFLRSTYALLGMITFFTIGEKEVKVWNLPKNSTALQAAGSIHTDMEKGFIRAEVIPWDQLNQYGSLQKAKEDGAVRLEGKDYIVQDGDILYIRFAN